MNFKTDENLPMEVADLLRQNGHDALSVMDQQLAGRPDVDVAAACQAEQRVLVTLDLDFSDIRSYPPEDYFGIIVLRPVLQTIASNLRLTGSAISQFGTLPLAGHLWIVQEHQIRIRGDSSSESL
jgi:predicted nuclease of predicted toxin-antitoxin system